MVLNFWTLASRHDFSKVWRAPSFPDPDPQVGTYNLNLSLTDMNSIPSAFRAATVNPPFSPESFQRFVAEDLTPEERRRLFAANSVKGEPSFKLAFSDVFFIPARYRTRILTLYHAARDRRVFHEVAVPTVFDAVLQPHEWQALAGGALYRISDSTHKFALYDPCWAFFHKVKTSRPLEWDWLVETVFRYGPMIREWECFDSGHAGLTTYERIQVVLKP